MKMEDHYSILFRFELSKIKRFGSSGFGRETNGFLTMLISKVAEKQDMHTSIEANYVRAKLSFEIVKSQVLWKLSNTRQA